MPLVTVGRENSGAIQIRYLHDVVLAGFGMGTGEVARYLAAYGSRRVRCAAMIAPVLPFLLAAQAVDVLRSDAPYQVPGEARSRGVDHIKATKGKAE